MNGGSDGGTGSSYEGDAPVFQHPARRPLLQRLVPVTENLPRYRGGALRQDLLAGVTVAALALPASLAYAEIAGLSPVIGLYALLLPAVAYAILGSSRQLIVGPDGAIAAMVGAAVIPLVVGAALFWRWLRRDLDEMVQRIVLAGLAFAFIDRENRPLHDRFSKTIVIRN